MRRTLFIALAAWVAVCALLTQLPPLFAQSQVISGGGGVSTGSSNTWTGTQTFIDNAFFIVDNGDQTKKLAYQVSGITTGSTTTWTVAPTTVTFGSGGGTVAGTSYGVSTGNPLQLRDATGGQQFAFWSHALTSQTGKALTEGAATNIVQLAIASGAREGYFIEWNVEASDGTDHQDREGMTYVAMVNKAGTETCSVGDVGTTVVAVSVGTLTVATTCDTTPVNAVNFQLNATSSLTQTSLTATYTVVKSRQGVLTAQ